MFQTKNYKKKSIIFVIVLIYFVFHPMYAYHASANTNEQKIESKAAILIDDFGGSGKGIESFLDSDIPITVAIMPFLENSTEQAELAHKLGFEVIIHMPMEPKQGKLSWLGPNPITADLSLQEVRNRIEDAIEDVPHARGFNQHMGSKIVEQKEMVETILEVASEHQLYVIDSGTNPASHIPELAEKIGIPFAKRDIFLDDTHSSQAHVYKMAKQLADIASLQGEAIGIGHVGINGHFTFQAIQEIIPYFKDKQVEIVPASQIVKTGLDKDPTHFWENKKALNQ